MGLLPWPERLVAGGLFRARGAAARACCSGSVRDLRRAVRRPVPREAFAAAGNSHTVIRGSALLAAIRPASAPLPARRRFFLRGMALFRWMRDHYRCSRSSAARSSSRSACCSSSTSSIACRSIRIACSRPSASAVSELTFSQQSEHAADDFALQCLSLTRAEEVAERVCAALGRFGRVSVFRLHHRWGVAVAAVSSRAASSSRADWLSIRVAYFEASGDCRRGGRDVISRADRESGGRSLVCTTGVGTPDSERIVTAASPIPSCAAAPRGRSSDFGNVRTVARRAFSSSSVNARRACCTRFPSWARTSSGCPSAAA